MSSRPTRAAPRRRSSSHLIGGPGLKIPSNTHFDTTRGNIEATGAEAIDLPAPEGLDPAALRPFKGNIDLARARGFPGGT